MKFRTSVLSVLLLFAPLLLIGQRDISGVVTDGETNEFLIGANIILKGTSTGTITDLDGQFSLTIPDDAGALIISYTGYEPLEVTIGNQDQYQIVMTSGAILDEVVVIGYGTVKKEDATGSIQTIDSEKFNKGAITSPQELLTGKVAGVQITTDGSPGAGSTIRIRGGSSLSASNSPLIVIDGVPIDNGGISGSRNPLNLINPNDIESFTVLKDASATAIYGSRASNGVILITTKKGSLGKGFNVDYAGSISFSDRIADLDILTADEFRSFIAENYAADHPAQNLLGSEQTDWQAQIFETGVGMDHNISVSGAVGKFLPYRISGGFTDKKGILKTDAFERLTGAINLNPGFFENALQINATFKGMKSKNHFANTGAIGSAQAMDPTRPVLDESSAYGGYFTWTDASGLPNTLSPANPLALLNQVNNESDVSRFIASATIDYRLPFLPALRANLNVAHDESKGEGTIMVPTNAAFAFDAQTGGGTNNSYNQNKKNQLLEFYLNYGKSIGKHKIDLLAGYSWQRFFYEDSFANSDLAGTASESSSGENTGELFLLSLYGRANVTLFDKILLTGTLRRDASSRFSPENRWGLFPAAAVAYKLVDRENGFINSLKLRLGYGITGQQEIGSYYEYQSRYLSSANNAQYQFGNEFITTFRPEGYDENIKWEETTTYNIGLDFSMLSDRLSGSLEYYIRETKDLLNFIRVPAGTNLTNFISTNVGSLENKGIEFTIQATPILKDNFSWDIGFNVTANQNEITKLNATDDEAYKGVLTGGISGGVGNTIQIHSVGFAASSFYVYEQVYDELGIPIEGLYVDRNADGVINSEDQYRFENPAPDMFFGLNTGVKAGSFSLNLAGRANIGNYIYNNVQSDQAVISRVYHPTNYLVNTISDVNEIKFQNPEYFSDHFIQEGSFFRLDYISLAYNFQKLFTQKSDITLSATMQNPLLITNYSGVDPEVFSGVDSNIYPRSRTIVFGINAHF